MEAEKIIMAAELCTSYEDECDKCPYNQVEECPHKLNEDMIALLKSQQAQIEELTNKHWQECGQISQYANGVPINLPCEVGATVYVIIGKKIKGKKKPVPQIEKGAVDRFIIGGAGVPMAEICLDSGVWCTACELGSYYLTLEEAEEALKEETKEQKK